MNVTCKALPKINKTIRISLNQQSFKPKYQKNNRSKISKYNSQYSINILQNFSFFYTKKERHTGLEWWVNELLYLYALLMIVSQSQIVSTRKCVCCISSCGLERVMGLRRAMLFESESWTNAKSVSAALEDLDWMHRRERQRESRSPTQLHDCIPENTTQ